MEQETERRLVSKDELVELINSTSCRYRRQIYALKFRRSTPKCPHCGKHSAKWSHMDNAVCECGTPVEYVAKKNCYIPRITDGMSTFQYFEVIGNKMKQCKMENVQSVEFNGLELFVM